MFATYYLPYRKPFDFSYLLTAYASHRVGELESFADGRFHRFVAGAGRVGEVTVSDEPACARLRVDVRDLDAAATDEVLARVRAMFDLDVDPKLITRAFAVDSALARLWRKHRGLRLASGWDAFEVAMVTILGQFVSVAWGRALVHQLIDLAGEPTKLTRDGRAVKLFPTPERVITADLGALKTTGARKETIKAFSRALVAGEVSLDRAQDVEDFTKRALAIRGIGPWSANYMALRVLRHADAFPATDLILARALAHHPPAVIDRVSPYRGYAAALLWREYAESLSKRPRPTARRNPRTAAAPSPR